MKVVKHSFDGVIVGARGAGLRAAIEAATTHETSRNYKTLPY